MGQQVVTELVISADTAGADRFSQAMAGAQQAADNGVSSVTGLNVGLVALGTGALAALVSVKGLLDYVVSANKDLADMATTAKQVGLTLTDFQGIRFGGAIKGLSTDQINAGLEKSASLLNDASRNSNTLSKELEANGISVKNANGQLISENQLLGIAANLIKNANNPGDQLAIAQMLGFTKEWIPLLEQGEGTMRGLAAEASAAGAVIDKETIDRATQFDSEWRKSSVEFSLYMKSAMMGLLPFIDDLIERAAKFAKSFDRDKIEKAANDQLDTLSGAAGGPKNSDNVGLKIDITPEAKAAIDEIANASSMWDGFVKTMGFFAANRPIANVGSVSPAEMKWYAGSGSSIEDTSGAQNTASWLGQGNSLKSLQDNVASSQFGGGSKVASKDVAGDAVDRAINSLQKHVETQKADTLAVGLGDGALAAFRATAVETAAVLANNGKETDAQRESFAKLKVAASDAADALARAKVASQIDFNRKTSFLSAEDVTIATQLKGIYGNDVPRALASTEASAIRTNTALKGISTSIENNLTSGLTDIVSGTKSVSLGFHDMAASILKDIEQLIIKALIVQPLMRSLGLGSLGSLVGGSSSSLPTPGMGNFIGPVASAHGNVFGGGNVIPFARGGVVDSPTIAPMAMFGEAGPEAIVPLRRGADGNLGIASKGGGGDTHITYQIDASGADSGTVQAIQRVLAQHAVTIGKQGKAMADSQRFTQTGVR